MSKNGFLGLPSRLGWGLAAVTGLLFACSSLRHWLYQSSALDLGYFDHAVYLISRGLPPIVSFWGYHVLGGHADWILYLIAPLYWIHADVHWLLAIQAVSLAGAALPLWHLARQAGLNPAQSQAVVLSYWLYPLVFNLNLFDFHPEVMALPGFLGAVWAARARHWIGFTVCVALILGCRDALSLTVAAMGLWLWLFERRRRMGLMAMGLGLIWFGFATQVVIPYFRPGGVESVARYGYLGRSLGEICQNLVLRPDLFWGRLVSLDSLLYLVLLLAPLAWGLSWRHLAPLLVILPTLAINLLSESAAQRDLTHQYALPALPFLLVAAIAVLADDRLKGQGSSATPPRFLRLWRQPRWIVLWSVIGFLALAKFGFFGGKYLDRLDTWQPVQQAVAQITMSGPVLTTSDIVPHLSHRPWLDYTKDNAPPSTLQTFDYVLLNLAHPGWASTPALAQAVLQMAQQDPQFRLQFQQGQVYLFVRVAGLSSVPN
jgi:uncharacterized membrane protein